MSLVLELSPVQEEQITRSAEREGLPVTEYAIRRLSQPESYKPTRTEFDAVFAPIHAATRDSGETEAEIEAFTETLVKEYRAERRQRRTKS